MLDKKVSGFVVESNSPLNPNFKYKCKRIHSQLFSLSYTLRASSGVYRHTGDKSQQERSPRPSLEQLGWGSQTDALAPDRVLEQCRNRRKCILSGFYEEQLSTYCAGLKTEIF